MKGFHRIGLRADFEILSDIDERRNVRIARPQRARDYRAHVRGRHRQRRSIPVCQ
jgi:hypothetical protein